MALVIVPRVVNEANSQAKGDILILSPAAKTEYTLLGDRASEMFSWP
jgi:hypothetical protein